MPITVSSALPLPDVVAYLEHRGMEIPERTDCALCFFQRLGEWWSLWRDHPDEYQKGVEIEQEMGYTFRSDGRDTWPASLAALRARFERGDIPKGAPVQGELFKSMQCRGLPALTVHLLRRGDAPEHRL